MKKNALFLVLVFIWFSLLPVKTFAIENNLLFLKAQKYYEEKDYESAIKTYKEILNHQVISSELFYNLGNCYYKTDSIGRAIQYYEKARKLSGVDDDLMYNLKVAHSKTIDKIEPMPEFIITSTWKNIVNYKTADNWAEYAAINFFMVFFALILFHLAKQPQIKKMFFGATLIFLTLSSLFYFLAKNRNESRNTFNHGVIITASVSVKSEPQTGATQLFVVHEGTVFRIVESQNNWLKIRLDNGNVGWVTQQEIGTI